MRTSMSLGALLGAASSFVAASALAASSGPQIYIVQTRGEPAATYAGGRPGLPATRMETDGRFDAESAAVRAYLRQLSSEHARIVAQTGVRQVYDYGITLNGFAAEMTEAQAIQMATRDDVVAVHPFRTYDLDTLRTPAFLELNAPGGLWRRGKTGEEVVIGILDGGIWPEHPCVRTAERLCAERRAARSPTGRPPRASPGSERASSGTRPSTRATRPSPATTSWSRRGTSSTGSVRTASRPPSASPPGTAGRSAITARTSPASPRATRSPPPFPAGSTSG